MYKMQLYALLALM